MAHMLARIRATGPAKWVIVPRVIAALPLTVFGAFHLTGRSPLMQILERADIPFPHINFYLAPVIMVASGLSLGLGWFARIGAIFATFAMAVAAYSKVVIEEWPGPMEIPLALPVVVMAASLTVLICGAGARSADRRWMKRARAGG
jgi:uncharacterized membrane protein YphA (DoxX/SURF4 family)